MNNKNREQLLLIVAVAAIVLMVGDRFVLQPLTASWKARTTEIADLQKKVLEGGKLLERDRVVRERWNSMRANALTNDTSAAEAQALRAFERWSKDSGVNMSGIKPAWKRANTGEDYQTLECRADATGTLASLAKFLYQVEKDPMAMRVDVVDLTTRDTDGRNLTMSLQLSGLVLMPKNNETPAK